MGFLGFWYGTPRTLRILKSQHWLGFHNSSRRILTGAYRATSSDLASCTSARLNPSATKGTPVSR